MKVKELVPLVKHEYSKHKILFVGDEGLICLGLASDRFEESLLNSDVTGIVAGGNQLVIRVNA